MLPGVEILNTKIGKFAVFKVDDTISRNLRETGDFEPVARTIAIGLFPGKDAVCVDVGSNMGTLSIPMGLLNPKGKVFSFEAQRTVFNQISANIFLNSLNNVFVQNLAIGNPIGRDAYIDVPQINFQTARNIGAVSLKADVQEIMLRKGKYDIQSSEKVPLTSLDNLFFDREERIDFIKIDVEGMEIEVLEGSRNIIDQHKPVVFFESWSEDVGSRENINKYFKKHGYEVLYLGEDGLAFPSTGIRTGRKVQIDGNRLNIV